MSKRLLAGVLHGFIPVVILVSLLVLLLPALSAAAPVSNWTEETSFATSPDQLVASPAGWELQAPPAGLTGGLVGIWGASSSDVFAISSGGALIRYDGNKWSLRDPGPLVIDVEQESGAYAADIWGRSSTELFVAGDKDWTEACVFRYDGSNWTKDTSVYGDSTSIFAVWGSSSTDIFALGSDWDAEVAIVLHYDGTSWTNYLPAKTDPMFEFYLSDIWGSSSSNVFAAGGGWRSDVGAIFRYNGSKWIPMDSGTTNGLNSIWGDSSYIYAVGEAGTILRCAAGGSTWSRMDSGTMNDLYGICGDSSYTYVVGEAGTIRRCPVGSTSWSPMTSDTTNDLFGIWGSGSAGFFAVGNGGTILHYTEGASPVTTTNPATNVTANSATLNGNLTSLGSASSVRVSFEWGLTTAYGNTTAPQTMTGAGSFSHAISSLVPGTTYHFRAKAVGDGTSYGADRALTTPRSGRPDAPTLLSPANGAKAPGTSVTFKWNASSGATKYFLIVSTNPSLSVAQSNSSVRKFYGQVNATQRTVTGFGNTGKTYYWWVYAGNSSGWCSQAQVAASGGWSVVNGTGGGTPTVPAAPTLSSPANGANVSGTSVTFKWNASPGATKYFLIVSTNPSLSVAQSNSGVRKFYGQVDAMQRTVTGFPDNGTKYYWWVYAGNTAGWCSQAQVVANGGWSLTNGS